MKYRLDPLSPNGLSPVGEERVIIKNGGGAVHTGAKFLNDLGDVNVSGGATDNQALAWDDATQKWIPQTISGGSGAVDSVNGQTGVVVLDADDIDDTSTTNKFVTAAEKSDISTAVQPGDLATVATTGDYTDLSNTPTIPTSVDDLNPSQTGNSGKFLTTDGTNSSWASIPGGGDMLASTYDPQNIAGDAFSQDNMTDGTTNKNYTATEKTKLAGIEDGAEVNNISDANATDLTDSGDTALHYHSADRNRANHTGTQTASTISDFDTEVSNNTDVAANTAARHAAVTVTDSSEIDFTLTGQNITASLVSGSVDETKLDTSVNASLDLADSSTQPGDNVSTLTNDAGYLASVTAADVDSEASTDGYVLTSDGAGGAAWEVVPGGGSVSSVNGQTGTVVLDADDIDDTSTTNKFVTAADLTTLSNTSGTNTGDQDLSSYATKTGVETITNKDLTTGNTFPTFNQNTTGSAASLTTARTIRTNLASTSTASFDGTANVTPGVTGTLPVANGGSGRASHTAYALIAGGTTSTGAQQSVSGVGTAGQVLTSNGASALPTWQNASGGGITWSEVTGTSQSAAVNNGYITNNAALVTVTIPTTAAVGSIVRVSGKGAGGWKVAQNASESIHFGSVTTTTGTGGYLQSTGQYDSVELLCIVADTTWEVISSVGNITVV